MREEQLLALDAVCREYGVALIMARSYGLVGHVRISVAVRCPPPYPPCVLSHGCPAGAPGG
jgi:hypothetical protein